MKVKHPLHPFSFLALLLTISLLAPGNAAWARHDIVVAPHAAVGFATLPDDLQFPEGIAADPVNGDIYVATFDPGGANALLRYDRRGRLVARNDFPGPTPVLGLAFNARDRKVYLASVDDFTVGGSRIVRIAADFDGTTTPETVAIVPAVGAPPPRVVENPDGSVDQILFGNVARVPNALVLNARGDLFVSDSFQGAIFRIDAAHVCPAPACPVVTVAHDPLLATAGFPPFGANGVALNREEDALFVANTGDDRILRLDLATGAVAVFAESVHGADGLAFDAAGNLWVAANQGDRVVALDENGRVVAQLGAFLGLRRDGSPRGLLFPASLDIVGDDIFVTNTALPLPGATAPESDVTTYTVSRLKNPLLGRHARRGGDL